MAHQENLKSPLNYWILLQTPEELILSSKAREPRNEGMQWTQDKGTDILSSKGREPKTDSCWPNPLHLNNLLPKLSISMGPLFLTCLKSSRWCQSWFWQDLGHPLWVQDLDSLLNTFLLFLHVFQLQAPILPPPKQKDGFAFSAFGQKPHS